MLPLTGRCQSNLQSDLWPMLKWRPSAQCLGCWNLFFRHNLGLLKSCLKPPDGAGTRHQRCLARGRLTEHAQSEHGQNVCVRKGGDPIIFNNKECHIKGRTSAALCNCVEYEIRSGTMRHIGMHDFYQFNYWNLNLREREGEEDRAETPHSGSFILLSGWGLWKRSSMQDENSVRMWPTSPLPQAHGRRRPNWRLKEGHLVKADVCRPTAGFH